MYSHLLSRKYVEHSGITSRKSGEAIRGLILQLKMQIPSFIKFQFHSVSKLHRDVKLFGPKFSMHTLATCTYMYMYMYTYM